MSESVNIVFEISTGFDESTLLAYMQKAKEEKTKGDYELRVWRIDGLTIKQYERKLVVQGGLNDFTKGFLQGLRGVKGLTLDGKNTIAFVRVFPSKHNAILCQECGGTFLAIQGEIEGLDVVFKNECGHRNNLRPPIFMLNNRILPDLNMLISKSLSRLIHLGYFIGFEVVVPEFLLDVVDQFKGSGNKTAVSAELDDLRALERSGKIRMNSLSALPMQIDTSGFKDEDKVILGLAHLTNSVLITSDKIMKERAVAQERPTVYINPDDFGKIKMIQETRT
jgi:rRNA-processing protein FCF1